MPPFSLLLSRRVVAERGSAVAEGEAEAEAEGEVMEEEIVK